MPPNLKWQKLCECLGLSEYEAKVYISLVQAGVAKAMTLSLMSGVPRTKVYSVLRKLISMGLVVEVPEEPKEFAPAPPRTAFESYLRSYKSMAENLFSVVASLDEAFRKSKNDEMPQQGTIWIINGRQEILGKIEEMLSRAKGSVDLVTNENGLILLYKSFNRLLDGLAETSVRVRILTPFSHGNQYVITELKYTCKIEEIDFQLPFIFLCIDEKMFLLATLRPDDFSSDSAQDRGIFSENPILWEMISALMLKRSNASLLKSPSEDSEKDA